MLIHCNSYAQYLDIIDYKSPREIKESDLSFDSLSRDITDRMAFEFSCISDIALARKYSNYFYGEQYKIIDSAYSDLKEIVAVDARDYIIEQTKNERIVMINELHHSPNHRVFASSLLQGFYNNGFRYLAVEGLRNELALVQQINDLKFPLRSSGYYVEEPQFGNLLRRAMKCGFKLFAYESWGAGAQREYNQAKNISKIFENDPNAKIIIYAGSGHIREDSTRFGKMMAGYLTEISGFNPYTINQTLMNEQSQKELEHPFYQNLSNQQKPVIYLHKTTSEPIKDVMTDVAVIHPRESHETGRPNYFSWFDEYEKIIITRRKFLRKEALVFAFIDDEIQNGIDVIPIDLFWFDPKVMRFPILYLPFREDYTIVFKYDGGKFELIKLTVR